MFSATLMRGMQAFCSGSSGRSERGGAGISARVRDSARHGPGSRPPSRRAGRPAPGPARSGRCPKRRRCRRSRRREREGQIPHRRHARHRRSAASCRVELRAGAERAGPRRPSRQLLIADHHRAPCRRASSSATSPPPTIRPRRRTVTSSAKAITSRNLWVMIRTVMRPACDHVADHARAPRRPRCGVSTEVGSSRIRNRRSR